MTTPFADLLASLPEERRRRIAERTEELLADLALQELRQARSLSQEELGRALNINQASVSKLERRTDMYISTLRRVVEAMGGRARDHRASPRDASESGSSGICVGEGCDSLRALPYRGYRVLDQVGRRRATLSRGGRPPERPRQARGSPR